MHASRSLARAAAGVLRSLAARRWCATIASRYAAAAAAAALTHDPAQAGAAAELDRLVARVHRYAASRELVRASNVAATALAHAGSPHALPLSSLPPPRVPRGMYLWGGVGTGKSMLMDLAAEAARACVLQPPTPRDVLDAAATAAAAAASPTSAAPPLPPLSDVAAALAAGGWSGRTALPVRRTHFHAFMLDVHARVHAWRKADLAAHGRSRHVDLRPERDAVVQVAAQLADETWLLCFDELQVTDVADALILGRLLGGLLARGVVVVSTSNRPLALLYEGGLNRERFLPCLQTLATHVQERELLAARDYRVPAGVGAEAAVERGGMGGGGGGTGHDGAWFSPLGPAADAGLAAHVCLLPASRGLQPDDVAHVLSSATVDGGGGGGGGGVNGGGSDGNGASLRPLPTVYVPVAMGRQLEVVSPFPGVAVAFFDELCSRPLGAADYAALARRFRTLVLLGLPLQTRREHDAARRLVTLVDELYEARTQLIATAAAQPSQLFHPLLHGGGETDGEVDAPPALLLPLALDVAPTTPPPASVESAATAAAPVALHGVPGRTGLAAGAVPAAQSAALRELCFAAARAVSRLTEMTSAGFASSPTTAAALLRRQREDGAADAAALASQGSGRA